MSNDQDVLFMPGDAVTGGLPAFINPENLDAWPSKEATQTALKTITQIIKRGFTGVRFETYPIADDRIIWNLLTNGDTPEGRMAQVVLALAHQGKSLPVDESLAMLERIYLEKGMVVPHKTGRPTRVEPIKGALR
jgi:hypothetical protein